MQRRTKLAEAQNVGDAIGRDAGGILHGHHTAGCKQQRRMECTNGEARRKTTSEKKSKGNSHTTMDLRKGEYHGVEDDEKNLVMGVLTGDAPSGQKELAR